MSLTLGEKLRQAREDRGYSISEVSEHTRISPLYLESIENNDYSILPGGIFNKGFVKSYAKFVGINEQEALYEYSQLISATESPQDDDKPYRPEVLTDDGGGRSMIPTVIVALLILGVMTAAVLLGLRYLRGPETVVENAPPANTAESSNENTAAPENTENAAAPEMGSLTVEFTATTEPVSLTATSDGKTTYNTVAAGSSTEFKPEESLKLSYSRSLASVVQLKINGKNIALPAEPLVPRRNVIEFEINRDNLAEIWSSGAISTEVKTVAVDTETPAETPANTVTRPTPAPKATTPASTATAEPKASASPKPSIKPPANVAKPAANRP